MTPYGLFPLGSIFLRSCTFDGICNGSFLNVSIVKPCCTRYAHFSKLHRIVGQGTSFVREDITDDSLASTEQAWRASYFTWPNSSLIVDVLASMGVFESSSYMSTSFIKTS